MRGQRRRGLASPLRRRRPPSSRAFDGKFPLLSLLTTSCFDNGAGNTPTPNPAFRKLRAAARDPLSLTSRRRASKLLASTFGGAPDCWATSILSIRLRRRATGRDRG